MVGEQHTDRRRRNNGPRSPRAASLGKRVNAVAHRVIAAVLVVAALVGAYFLLEAFLPRWWAQQVGHAIGGGFAGGSARAC